MSDKGTQVAIALGDGYQNMVVENARLQQENAELKDDLGVARHMLEDATAMCKTWEASCAELKRGWTPVSERLPEPHINCLVAYDGFRETVASRSGLWWFIPVPKDDDILYHILDKHPTHWMPLPEPPK